MKKTLLILILLPTILFAQKQNTWQLLLNNKTALQGKIGEQKEHKIIDSTAKSIKIKLHNNISKKWKVSFIIMDTNRVEVVRKKLAVNENIFSIDKKYFLNKDNQKQDLIVYTIRIPSDKKTAMLVKVAPQPLVKLSLQ